MEKQYKVIWINKTGIGCPATFEGELEDGRMFGIHLRWGNLAISLKPQDQECFNDPTYIASVGDELNGFMNEDELKEEMEKLGFDFEDLDLRF